LRSLGLLSLAVLLLLHLHDGVFVGAQLSQPIAHDSNMDTSDNKYLQRDVDHSKQPYEREEDELFDCPLNVELSWMTEVSSSIYSTPLITDLFSDGAKEIVIPSFVHYLEILEAADGAVASGWPAFHKSSTHASPLLTDIDFDGVQDIAMATYDGEIMFFKDNGEQAGDKMYLPRLRVRKNWHVGLNPDHVDHSKPDVNDPDIGREAAAQNERLAGHDAPEPTEPPKQRRKKAPAPEDIQDAVPPKEEGDVPSFHQPDIPVGGEEAKPASPEENLSPPPQEKQPVEQPKAPASPEQQPNPSPPQLADEVVPPVDAGKDAAEGTVELPQAGGDGAQEAVARRRLLADGEATVENEDPLPDEAAKSFKVFEDDEDKEGDDYAEQEEEEEDHGHGHHVDYEEDDYNDEDYIPFKDERKDKKWHEEDGTYEDYEARHEARDDYAWQDEDFMEQRHEAVGDYVMVDAHILCTPAIADLDGDGHDELVVAVSYFYDREYYDMPEHKKELGEDIDIANYIASGIVVFELHSRSVKWSQHLDLSTDFTKYRAYIYSSPTIVDVNHDGNLDVVVGTSVGFLYVLDNKGEPMEGWPVQMGEIQGQPLVADFNGDGFMEIFAADTRGNIALFNYKGNELWEHHVGSLVAQMATAGDVNGDGNLEIVFGTGSGHVHVVSGETGEELPNFPFRTGGRVMAPVLIVKLLDNSKAQHLVVQSFDGILYMIDGITGCADTIDIGETSYSMVLADDLNGNGKMDLLVSTMNGNVYRFETPSKYHPMKVWSSQNQGRNNMVARHGYEGVYATEASRAPRDVRGQQLSVRFEIVDNRRPAVAKMGSNSEPTSLRGPYTVSVTLQGVGVEEMNMGDQPVIGMVDVFAQPGTYELTIPCPRTRSTATISIEMTDESKVVFTDSYSLSFHMHFYRLMKWMVLLPFTMMAAVVLAMQAVPGLDAALPSFALPSRSHDA